MMQEVLVFGAPLERLPKDLYIPPQHLRVLLESFSGPLDLLLYLIRRENMDILDIEVGKITEQYLEYIGMMEALDIVLAADYLLMAATLMQIKAHMLLPKAEFLQEEDEDPRAQLVERLLDYQELCALADALRDLPSVDFRLSGHVLQFDLPKTPIKGDVLCLKKALQDIYQRRALLRAHTVDVEPLSVVARMDILRTILEDGAWHVLSECYRSQEGRAGVVVSLLAMLELERARFLCWQQDEAFAPIFVRRCV